MNELSPKMLSPDRLKRGFLKQSMKTSYLSDESMTKRRNSFASNPASHMLNQSADVSGMDKSMQWFQTTNSDSMSEYSVAESTQTEGCQTADTLKEKTEALFLQYCKILELRSNEVEVFDLINQLADLCGSIVKEAEKNADCFSSSYKNGFIKRSKKTIDFLEQEMNTWKLIHSLYYDRKMVQSVPRTPDEKAAKLHMRSHSEKRIIANLFLSNANVREYQLVVDWLEDCFKHKDRAALVSRLAGKNVGLENTLLQLLGKKDVGFCRGDIVTSLDPDAPIRENRHLHPLDEEDDLLLSKCVFYDIRSGHLDDATVLLTKSGQHWKALLLQGWRLFDDPNFYGEEAKSKAKVKLPIEGNCKRDIWKYATWSVIEKHQTNEYNRAALGALCGHLDILKSVVHTWDDLLWAYLKVQVDIRVESEIRALVGKSLKKLPDEYWNQRMSLEKIFEELSVHVDASVRNYANSYIAVIQKYIILDDSIELLNQMNRWIEDPAAVVNSELTPHHLRFFTHILLFLKQIGRIENEEKAEKVIGAYVDSLIEKRDAHLVAFYCSCLRPPLHVKLYSRFLEQIPETGDRSIALEEAMNLGLETELILKTTVENARKKQPSETENVQMQVGTISAFDEQKIKALEWLTFMPSQRVELFWQSNAMIRHYLGEGKTECVKGVLMQIPKDSINQIMNTYGSKENLPTRERYGIKEHLSYKVYIAAIGLFSAWFELYKDRPKEPEKPNQKNGFVEKVAMEHKEQMFSQEFARWKKSFDVQTAAAHDALYNILLFPEGGWLVDPDVDDPPVGVSKSELENRSMQMEKIRSICIPEVTLLLHKLLTTQKDYKACLKLANDIASEERQLYKIFSKDKLSEFLGTLATSSMELLNLNFDAFGFPKTA